MEVINHECYVSFEVAKLLKELGFDWETEYGQHIWDSCKRLENNRNFNSEKYLVSLPTLEVAQRWLREVKNCYVGVEVFVHNLDKNNIYYTYKWIVYLNGDRHSGSDYDNTRYYEVALETSIKKALELILEKGK